MANNSAKKAEKNYQAYYKLYLQIVAGLYVWFFLYRIVYHWDSFTFGPFFGLLVLTGINAAGLHFLFRYLEHGHPRSSYGLLEELLWVNWFIMFTSTFSGYFWLLYLLVPGYFFYAYRDTIMSILSTVTGGAIGGNGGGMTQAQMEAWQNDQQTAQQNSSKQKVKYLRG